MAERSGLAVGAPAGRGTPRTPIPFPVDPVYRVRADLRRWSAADGGHLRFDDTFPDFVRAKLDVLERDGSGCRVIAPDADRCHLDRVLRRVAATFAAEAPWAIGTGAGSVSRETLAFPAIGIRLLGPSCEVEACAPQDPGACGGMAPTMKMRDRVARHLRRLPPLERLADALALSVQEDLVLMAPTREDATESGRADLLHVCFPSAWDPAARAGASFEALHRPVPHHDELIGAGPRVVRAMLTKGPFVRYVWSLAPDGALDRNPRRVTPAAAPRPDALWFRVERQTTLGLADLHAALFTIRVYVAPLREVLETEERRHRLASAVRSMDSALRLYKGMAVAGDEQVEDLLGWLERPGAA